MNQSLIIDVKYPQGTVLHPNQCYRFHGRDADDRIKKYCLKDGEADFPDIQRMLESEDWRNLGCEKKPMSVEVEILGGDLRIRSFYDFLWGKKSRKVTVVNDTAGE